jgi:hypothetical protein
MFNPKDYVQPKEELLCVVTSRTASKKSLDQRIIQPYEIFKVFSCTWVEYRSDWHIVLFVPHIQDSLTLLEAYAKDFELVTDKKTLNLLKLLYD